MKRRLAIIMAALLIAAMAGCQQSGTSSPADSSTVQSSADSSAAESAESQISEAQSSVVSEAASAESSEENSKTSKAESSENKSKTESSRSKTEESSKKETSKAESSKTETSKTESSKSESSKTAEPKATGISIDSSTLSLTSGHTQELNAYILWSNGTSSYNGITWSSSNSSVASVSSSGYVTAKSAGTATITASYGSFKKSCTVTVKAAQVSQPSQPSGGGSSQTTKPSTPTETSKPSETSSTDNYYDAKYYPKGDFFKSHGCPVVKTMSGRTTYDITAYILPTINKYRQREGKQTLVADTYEYEYDCLCKYGQSIKNERPRRAERIKAGEDNNFNSDFTPRSSIFNRDTYNEGVVNLANCIELASAGGHGDGHGANILSDWGNFDMDRGISQMKGSPSHWSSLMDSDATSVQVILWISNEDAALGNQGYHLAIGMGDDFSNCGW